MLLALLLACTPAPPPAPAMPVHIEGAAPTERAVRDNASVNAVPLDPVHPLEVTVAVPAEGRLDLSLIAAAAPVRFRILAGEETLFDDRVDGWRQVHVDLSAHQGRTLGLRFQADGAGFLGAPTVSGTRPDHPNVLFYVIDGGGAELMSLYGYERDTTPNLRALAEEAVVFDHARVNAAWTKPSTASYMTSLHHSVLGGFDQNEDRIPDAAVTMAQHFHRAGWQTAVFTTNPFAGSMSGLEREVDLFRDTGATLNARSSDELHEQFWQWREDWPGGPWWAHFQTTDVHEPHAPVAPQAGTWADADRRAVFEQAWEDIKHVDIQRDTVLERFQARLGAVGVDPRDFFRTQWDLYDESMLHNDASLGAFVQQLKDRGEWEDTIFIVSADHGHPAGSFSRFGRGMLDPAPPAWEGALADSWRTWVPLVVSWPGHLPQGVRIDEPVSMVDLLPTLLELAALPPAPVQQGRSLVPLLKGADGWTPKPVVLEQVQAWPETGEMVGHIELVDGRWAASLEVMPERPRAAMQDAGTLTTNGGWRAARPHRATTPQLLLYDLESDPHCLSNVNDAHPDRVTQYTARLEALWSQHLALAGQLGGAEEGAAGDAQIDALRVLGYVE